MADEEYVVSLEQFEYMEEGESEAAPESEIGPEELEAEGGEETEAEPIDREEGEDNVASALAKPTDQEAETVVEEKDSTKKDDDGAEITDEMSLIKKYDEIYLKIQKQNKVLAELKSRIREKSSKCPRTACEEREICNYKICMERENLKLQCLVRDARNLQVENPTRRWPPIEMETTLDEEWLPIRMDIKAMTRCIGTMMDSPVEELTKTSEDERYSKSETSSQTSSDSLSDKCFKSCKSKTPKSKRYSVKDLNRTYSAKDKLVADNAYLECERNQLKEKLHCSNSMVDTLQKKLNTMQCELKKFRRKSREADCSDVQSINQNLPKIKSRVKDQNAAVICLSKAMDKIQNSLNCLKHQVEDVRKTREFTCPGMETFSSAPTGGKVEHEMLKRKYCELLEDYSKKNTELVELRGKVDYIISGRQISRSGKDSADEAELSLLRQKLQEARAEHEELKIIICEQSKQSDDYRQKYMNSLQKIEELKCVLNKMEEDNKRVEEQINLEVQRIKEKFQEKLKDWAHLPQALENEQLKLAQCCREKEDLEMKLRIVSRELKTLKNQKRVVPEEVDPEKVRQLEKDLEEARDKYDRLCKCKATLCEEYERVKKELDNLRQESAKIICRAKERAENNQATLQRHIDELEHELAQCRATACLSVADREQVIKDMQTQLNCLAQSFDSAQNQIKDLKNHIVHMSKTKGVLCGGFSD